MNGKKSAFDELRRAVFSDGNIACTDREPISKLRFTEENVFQSVIVLFVSGKLYPELNGKRSTNDFE